MLLQDRDFPGLKTIVDAVKGYSLEVIALDCFNIIHEKGHFMALLF